MSSFEWMELQTLTSDIDMARSRLIEARKSGDQGRVGALEGEITRAEKRRLQLLAHISTNIVTAPEPAGPSKAKDAAGSRQATAPAAEAPPAAAKGESPGDAGGAPEPASQSKGRSGAGSRQVATAAAPAKPEPPAEEAASTPEAAMPAKAKEAPSSRPVAAAVAEAAPPEAAAQPPEETASAPEPAAPAKAKEATATRMEPEAAAGTLPDEVEAEPPPAVAAEPSPPPKAPEPAPPPKDAGSRAASEPVAEALPKEAAGKSQSAEIASAAPPAPPPRATADTGMRPAPAGPEAASKSYSVKGDATVWDQLKPSDIERVKNELGARRDEMIARHAEELKALEAEQNQLDSLEQAIEMFLQKANRSAGAAA